jgi:dihydrofolate reductase (trimethoprim resistance protein)
MSNESSTPVIDLDQVFLDRLKESASKSTWMPPEYTRNEWASDLCRFLVEGPSSFLQAPDEARADVKRRCESYGVAPGHLQWRWRNLESLPATFDANEVASALLDALVEVGGINAWYGDGLSCAVQIVERVWKLGREAKAPPSPAPAKFRIGDRVRKISGSSWSGTVVGTYSTSLTPEGYAVESSAHPGSVQIYPASALAPDVIPTSLPGRNSCDAVDEVRQ